MKALITGSSGFVGGYLRYELESHGYETVGLDIRPGEGTVQTDLLDAGQTFDIIRAQMPDVIFHLAGQADVGLSWKKPQLTMLLNVNAAVNIMDAVRVLCPTCRIVLVGSSDQYGNLGTLGASVSEETEMKPSTPYAVSKRAQEEMARLYARSYSLDICMTRSFNHGGAGQRTGFIIPDFASQIARMERGEQDFMSVGNLSSKRDYTHVKDVVRAYRLIAEKGVSGEVYNVGSGRAYSGQEVLDMMLSLSAVPVEIRADPSRMRPSDTPVICCDHSKLTRDTGWTPELDLPDIINDTLNFYRGR